MRLALLTTLLLLTVGGCRTTAVYQDHAPVRSASIENSISTPEGVSQKSGKSIQLVNHEQGNDETATDAENPYLIDAVEAKPTAVNLVQSSSLEELEKLALEKNPSIQKVAAEIEALHGTHLQAGLAPNPTVGVAGDDINEDGSGGRYGAYWGREIVRGNKLGLSQSVVCADIEVKQQQLAVMQKRLITDVRLRYYDLLVAQEKTAISDQLVELSQNALDASRKLLEAQEIPRSSVLQSEMELQNANVTQRRARNEQLGARRKLAALIGESDLPYETVQGNVRDTKAIGEFESAFDNLVNESPEIAALFATVERARRQLARESVEAVPNVTWQASLQYDTASDDLVTGFQIGMPIPTRNQNQGAIHRAINDISVAERTAETKALQLRQRLATAYEAYLDAKLQIDAYNSEILPRAQETMDLIYKGYQQGETDFLQLLTVQRTFFQTNLQYIDQLRLYWRQVNSIDGMLLSNSLN